MAEREKMERERERRGREGGEEEQEQEQEEGLSWLFSGSKYPEAQFLQNYGVDRGR